MVSNQSANKAIEHQVAEHNENLEFYLSPISKIFDIPHIINKPQGKQQIIGYYFKGKFSFMLLVSFEGFYHYGISYDGRHKKEDFKEQAKIVERHIHNSDAKNVLELAYGMGANMAFLARRNPDVVFDGVDLSLKPLKRFKKIPNAHFQLGDYHDLSAFKDSAYDIVFVIEALCYSTNKLQVLREVKRKLKRDGLFIIIDGCRRDCVAPLNPSEETTLKLMQMSWSLDKFECVKDVEDYMQEQYSIVEANDFSQYVLPSMTIIAHKVRYYFAHPTFAKLLNKLLSFEVSKSFIAAYLAPICVRKQYACYFVHVLKNNK
jgi:ubiquinone/menaquinone biosynthesis C-methylase UbiE